MLIYQPASLNRQPCAIIRMLGALRYGIFAHFPVFLRGYLWCHVTIALSEHVNESAFRFGWRMIDNDVLIEFGAMTFDEAYEMS
jgi:hypothetical protein